MRLPNGKNKPDTMTRGAKRTSDKRGIPPYRESGCARSKRWRTFDLGLVELDGAVSRHVDVVRAFSRCGADVKSVEDRAAKSHAHGFAVRGCLEKVGSGRGVGGCVHRHVPYSATVAGEALAVGTDWAETMNSSIRTCCSKIVLTA